MELSNIVIVSTILFLELVLAVPDQPPFTAQIVESLVKKEIAKKMPAAVSSDHKKKSMAGVHLKEATDAINKLVDESIVDRVQEAEKEVSQMLLRSIERHIQDAGKVLLKQDENTCKDKIDSCDRLKEAGVCESSKDAMVTNCPATCGFCGMLDNMKAAKAEGKKEEKEENETKPMQEQPQKLRADDKKEEELAEKIEQEMEHVNNAPIVNKDKKPKKEKLNRNHLKKHLTPKLKTSIPEEVRLLHQNMIDETFDHANLPLAVKTEPVEFEIEGSKAHILPKNDRQEEEESDNEQNEEVENEEKTKKQRQLEEEEKYKADKLKKQKEEKLKQEKLRQEQLKEERKKEEKLKIEKLRRAKKIKEERERIVKEAREKEAKERKKVEEKRLKEAEDKRKAELAKKKKLAKKVKEQQSIMQTLSGNDTGSSGNGETETETIEQTNLQQQTNDQIQQVQLTPSTEYAYGEPVVRYIQYSQPYEKPTKGVNQDATKRNTDKKVNTNRKLKDEIEVMVDKAFGELLL